MLLKTRIKRVLSYILPHLSDLTFQYWERAAQKNPFGAICTGHSEEEFTANTDSIIFHPSLRWYLGKTASIVDLGCGLGRMAPVLSPMVKTYIGIDFSPTMIVKARWRHQLLSNALFFINNGKTFPLPKGFVDIIFAELFFQHIRKPIARAYVKDARRVLGDGGIFLAQIPRMELYQDPVFAYWKKEVFDLFSEYSQTTFVSYTKAYYLIKARR